MDENVKFRIGEVKQNGYKLDIGGIFNRSWEIFSGIAAYSIIALVVYFVIAIIMSLVGNLIYTFPAENIVDPADLKDMYIEMFSSPLFILSNLFSLVVSAATVPILLSIPMMAKKFDMKENVGFEDIFIHYKNGKFMNIFLTYLVIQLLFMIGLALCILPGLFVSIATSLALPFVIFANASLGEALVSSKDIVLKNFGSIFVYGLACFGIVLVGAIACGVGLVVAIPLIYISMYVVYKSIIGIDNNNEIDEIGTDIYKDNPYIK